MKKWKIFAVFLLAISLLVSCGPGKVPPEESSESAEQPSSGQEEGQDDPVHRPSHADSAVPPKEGMVRSLFTNEWIEEEVAKTRPIAVIIPNEVHAVPHYSLSQADILYEARVEGSMTRMMAIYNDWQNIPKIGNIRSLRTYFAYWAFEWDPIIVHYGGPYFIYDLLRQDGNETIDGQYDSSSFYRTADREAPHNAYTSGQSLLAAIRRKGYSLEYRNVSDEVHFLFAGPESVNTLSQYAQSAENASHIDMTEAYPLTRCYFDYDEKTGLYYRSQYLSGGSDGPHMDAANDEQLAFRNILVQRVKQEDIGNGYLAMQCHDTTRDGWFFTQGKGIPITWEKTSDYGATRYYDENGLQIELNTGKTMILIIRDTDTFTYR